LRVCIFGTFDPRHHPRVITLEAGLRAAGFPTIRCNAPWDAPTHLRVASLRRPDILLLIGVRLVRAWIRLIAQRRRIGQVDVVIVGYLGLLDIHLARLLWRRSLLVLDHMAPAAGIIADRHASKGLWARIASALDRAATHRADVVVVDTHEHVDPNDPRWLVVPVGASEPWFAARRSAEEGGHDLRVVFFGLFTPLQGSPTIAHALRTLLVDGCPLEVTMVGRGQDLMACRRIVGTHPAVRWIDWVDGRALPRLVAAHDVCLGVFGTNPKARRVVPNKVFQGAASGCAIITSDTPPQRRLLGEAALLVPPGDSEALADALRLLAGNRELLRRKRFEAASLADRSFRPDAVTSPLCERLRAEFDCR